MTLQKILVILSAAVVGLVVGFACIPLVIHLGEAIAWVLR